MPQYDEPRLDTNFRIELKRIYLEESDSKVAALKLAMKQFLREPDSPDHVADLIEVAHKLAGAGATYGFPVISALGAALEALLKAIRNDNTPLTDEGRNAIARAVRAVEKVFARARAGKESDASEFPVIQDLFALAQSDPEPSQGAAAAANRPLVMVVEDDSDSLRIINLSLVKAGYRVSSVASAEEAMGALGAERPELIIVDVLLPGKDGYTLTQEIRQDRTFAFTPVIYVTTKSQLNDKIAGLQTGADDYITKPFEPEELVARVGAHLARVDVWKELSVKDALTRSYNHRYFHEQLVIELGRARRYNRGLSIAMVDVDHFRTINDTYGHQVGDLVLRRLSDHLLISVRNTDLVCRYGGEEFGVIMPETPGAKALEVLNRIRESVASQPLKLSGGATDSGTRNELHITISAGIASYPVDSQTKDELIAKSFKALDTAKKKGRNLVCIALDIEV